MTAARCHLPDQTTDIERYTSGKRDFFVPEQKETHRYCFARAATKNEQELHAAVVLPNKVREVVTDLAATRSLFTRSLHTHLRQFAGRHLGPQIEHVWGNDRPDEQVCVAAQDASDRELEVFEAAIEAVIEVMLEPVRAGLTDHPDNYDGFLIGLEDWGTEMRVPRPATASPRSTLPDEVRFTPMPPPGTTMTLAEKREYARKRLESQLPEACAEGRRKRRKPVREAAESQRRRTRRPDFRGTKRAVRQAEAEYKSWLVFYEDCRDTFRTDQEVVFPAGTVRFRLLGAICDPVRVTRCLDGT